MLTTTGRIVITGFLTVMGGILYRRGGGGKDASKNYPKMPDWMFNTKVRDAGTSACAVGAITLWFGWNNWWILVFALMWWAMTTYHSDLDGQDGVVWYEWLATGMSYGASTLPVAVVTGNWIGFWVRLGVVSILVCVWSVWMKNVVWEEVGRGVIHVGSIPLLLIGG